MPKKTIAIITGASSGIGEEFARQIPASIAVDELWLVARRLDRLEALSAKITQTRAIPVVADLLDPAQIEALGERMKAEDVNVRLLVNNAGSGKYGLFDRIPLEGGLAPIDLNIRALVHLTHLSLPLMSAGSEIINLASLASFGPTPGFAVYAATKAFVLSFSHAIRVELKSRGIRVLAVCPGPVKTDFFALAATEGADLNSFVERYGVAPADVVSDALAASRGDKSEAAYGWGAKLVRFLQTHTLRGLQARILFHQSKLHR